MVRMLIAMACSAALGLRAQEVADRPIAYSRSVVVPLNGVLLFDKVNEAWTWTFGKEPGAKLLRSDRNAGIMEGTARVNFRSAGLTFREESMGPVQYHILLNIKAGECRITVNELIHTGNRATTRGGVHLGLLTESDTPPKKVRGSGGGNARRLYAEVKLVAETRITSVLKAFEARLRASVEP